MTRSAHINRGCNGNAAMAVGKAIHAAVLRGLAIGQAVKIGMVRGIVIGYNIARAGDYPGTHYPLLVKTELGTAKFSLNEVMPARPQAGRGLSQAP
jgi:hypothetical protein